MSDVIERALDAYADAVNKHRIAFDDSDAYAEEGFQKGMQAAIRVVLEDKLRWDVALDGTSTAPEYAAKLGIDLTKPEPAP